MQVPPRYQVSYHLMTYPIAVDTQVQTGTTIATMLNPLAILKAHDEVMVSLISLFLLTHLAATAMHLPTETCCNDQFHLYARAH